MRTWIQLIVLSVVWFCAGLAVRDHYAKDPGVISCTGYQQAYVANILIKGNGLFNSNLDARMAADKIARVICTDTGL